MEFSNILVPLDFSEPSLRAVRLAVNLARHTGGRITLLHVGVVPHFYATELGMAGPSGPLFTQMSEEVSREQRHRLGQVAKEEVPEVMEHVTVLREGFPPEEIIAQVKAGRHDLVIMGTHGRTGIKRALLGSVTERVVRECTVPVMVTH